MQDNAIRIYLKIDLSSDDGEDDCDDDDEEDDCDGEEYDCDDDCDDDDGGVQVDCGVGELLTCSSLTQGRNKGM